MSGHVVYGQALYESRQLEEAKTVFEAALALDPENLSALRHLGDIARDSGDPATARTWYLRVLDADPRNDEVAGMLAELDAAAPVAADAAPPTGAPASEGWGDINPERSAKDAASASVAGTEATATKVDDEAEPAAADASPVVEPESAPDAVATPDAVVSARTSGPPPASLDQVLNDAFASEADTLEMEAPAARGASAATSRDRSPPPPPAEDDSFAEVDALFDEISPPRATGSQRAVTGSQSTQPGAERAAAKSSDVGATGDALFGDDATPESAGEAGDAVAGLETAEFVSPSREAPVTVPRRDTGSMAVQGLTSFDQPTDEDSSTRAAFVTETMAELYLQQGFIAEALDIYRQLLAQNPDDVSLRDRVDQLERGGKTSLSVAAVSSEVIEAAKQRHATRPVRTVRSFFGRLAGRRAPGRPSHSDPGDGESGSEDSGSLREAGETPNEPRMSAPVRLDLVGELFGDVAVSDDDERAASNLASAFSGAMFSEPEPTARGAAEPAQGGSTQGGRPAHAGGSELSLDQIFRETGPRNPRKSGAYSFDQFFSDGTPGNAGSPASGDTNVADASEAPEGDLEQFTAWLEGLKRK
jgi:tetratricopeptide (TPR) repeat protein